MNISDAQIERLVTATEKIADALQKLGFGSGRPGAGFGAIEGHTVHMDHNYARLSESLDNIADAIESLEKKGTRAL